jgi:hypothetical protein
MIKWLSKETDNEMQIGINWLQGKNQVTGF